MMEIVLFFIAAFFAEVIGTMAGFGSSTILLPVALFFFDFHTALLVVAIFHITGNIGRLMFFHSGLDWSLVIRFGVPSVVMTVIGALLVKNVSQDALKLGFGLFLLSYGLSDRNSNDEARMTNERFGSGTLNRNSQMVFSVLVIGICNLTRHSNLVIRIYLSGPGGSRTHNTRVLNPRPLPVWDTRPVFSKDEI